MAPFERRLRAARKAARHPRILVSDIERRLGVTYTAETLSRIKRLYPRVRFVWLMGADNLEQISEWKDWERVFASLPIAVFDRPAYGERALGSTAARRFADKRIDASRAASLADRRPPAWIFFPGRLSAASATGIREGGAVPAGEAAEGAE